MDGRVLIILAAILWGTTGTSQAIAPQGANPLAIGTMRLLVGGTALLLLAYSRGDLVLSRAWLRPSIAISGFMTATYQLSFFAGLALTGVAVGTVVTIGSAPIFAGVLGRFIRGEALSQRWIAATGMAVIGCVLLVLSGDATMQIDPLGVLLSLGAGLSYAVFALVNKHLIDTLPSDAVMAVSFGIGALLLLPTLLFVEIAWVMTTGGLLVVLHLGLIATTLAYILFGRGLKTTSISVTTTLTLTEPLTAALLGIFFLGEQLTAQAFVGLLLLFVGLLVLTIPRRRKIPI